MQQGQRGPPTRQASGTVGIPEPFRLLSSIRHGWTYANTVLMMLDRAAGRIVGSISLFHADWEVRAAEIGYGVRADERGKGYASEALGAIARWALAEGGVQRAWLTANTANVALVRVARKAGFRREGTLCRAWLEDDGLYDLAVFSLLDDEL